jgi:hypothetical protein
MVKVQRPHLVSANCALLPGFWSARFRKAAILVSTGNVVPVSLNQNCDREARLRIPAVVKVVSIVVTNVDIIIGIPVIRPSWLISETSL